MWYIESDLSPSDFGTILTAQGLKADELTYVGFPDAVKAEFRAGNVGYELAPKEPFDLFRLEALLTAMDFRVTDIDYATLGEAGRAMFQKDTTPLVSRSVEVNCEATEVATLRPYYRLVKLTGTGVRQIGRLMLGAISNEVYAGLPEKLKAKYRQ
jgi:acetyl-CoA acetyltransferase